MSTHDLARQEQTAKAAAGQAIVAYRKPYLPCFTGNTRKRRARPADNSKFETMQRYEAALGQSRNAWVNAVLDRVDRIVGSNKDARLRDGALRLEIIALREAAEVLERRLRRAANKHVIPAPAGTEPERALKQTA